MAVWGLDVQQVRQLSTQMHQQAEQIQQILGQLTGALNGTQWTGPDAQQFRNEWESKHTPALRNVVAALNDASTKARTNADQQEQTSSS